jgi:aspartyl-tRNA(Asn)/glutamyl-tRNA(Gln) amidotransferase subunit A
MIDRTATELLDALRQGQVSSEELTGAFFQQIRRREPDLKAFLHVDEENALSRARDIDSRRARGEALGPLAGLPVAIKDILCIQGQPTTCASKILQDFRPPYDAHVIERLKQADAVILGKTNLDEFAMGSSTENSAFQTTRNPWDLERTPGGSSGGSAVAVAARQSPLALGSDTGGSVRLPASFCGIVGLKPSYGRVSRYGLIAYGSSLDQIGPFGRTVADVALLFEVIAGHDRRDSTSANEPVPSYTANLRQPLQPLTIGVVREHFGAGLHAEVESLLRDALKVYQDQGVRIEDIELPHSPYAIATYYLVATAEASSNLARYDGVHFGHRAGNHRDLIDMMTRSRGEGFGAEVKRRIMLGTFALSSGYKDAYYLKALKVRRLIKDEFDRAFRRCDVILGPTAPTPAFRIGEAIDDPLTMYLFDIYTCPANLTGLPAVSVPCGFTAAGLPVGFQLTAPAFAEEKLLRIAQMYQGTTQWHLRRPA